MTSRLTLGIGNNLLDAILGYAVVFIGLTLLMTVIVIVGKIFTAIAKVAAQEKLDSGFRVITNCGDDAGQTVPHLHFHLIAGQKMGWSAEQGV